MQSACKQASSKPKMASSLPLKLPRRLVVGWLLSEIGKVNKKLFTVPVTAESLVPALPSVFVQ